MINLGGTMREMIPSGSCKLHGFGCCALNPIFIGGIYAPLDFYRVLKSGISGRVRGNVLEKQLITVSFDAHFHRKSVVSSFSKGNVENSKAARPERWSKRKRTDVFGWKDGRRGDRSMARA